jgi:hypothetical protein
MGTPLHHTSVTRRIVLFAVIVAGLMIGVAPSWAKDTPTVLRFLDVEEGGTFVDVDRSGGFEPTIGDQFITIDGLYAWAGTKRGDRVGRAHVIGTIVSPATAVISATAVLRDGTVQVEGVLNFTSRVSTLAVTGGTGRYAGARGTLTVRNIGGDESSRSSIVIRLIT